MIYIYIRMSHRYSAKSGISEAMQLQTCLNYANSLRLKPTFGKQKFPEDMPNGVFCDRATSAWKNKLADRPAGAALLSILQPGDEVIFYNVERAYRTVVGFCQETEMLISQGITPHFVLNNLDFSSATGKMIGRVMAVIAEYYSDMISERTREALAIKRERGETGSPKERRVAWGESDVYLPPPKPKLILPNPNGTIRSYIRVSHEYSVESGLSLEHQQRANHAYAERFVLENTGLSLHETSYDDLAVSAFHKPLHRREAGSRLLADAQPGDHILFYRCDRGFRMPYDCAQTAQQLKERGIAIHLVDSGINSMTPIGSLYMHLMSIFGALESEIKSQRMLEMAAIARASGRPTSKTPVHCTVSIQDSKKILSYDYNKMTIQAVCWILRTLGYGDTETAAIASRMICIQKNRSLTFIKRKKLGLDKNGAEVRIYRWKELQGNIPRVAVIEATKGAIQLLESELPEKLIRHCKHLDLPMENIAARLIAAGIEPELVGMTPNHSLSAST